MSERQSEQRRKLIELAREHGRRLHLEQAADSPKPLSLCQRIEQAALRGEQLITPFDDTVRPSPRQGLGVWQWDRLHVRIPVAIKAWLVDLAQDRPGGYSGVLLDLLVFLEARPWLVREAFDEAAGRAERPEAEPRPGDEAKGKAA